MSGLLGLVISAVLLRYLFRVAGGGGDRIKIRFRLPLRHRFPRLWWTAVTIGLLVAVVAVGCGL